MSSGSESVDTGALGLYEADREAQNKQASCPYGLESSRDLSKREKSAPVDSFVSGQCNEW